MKSLQTEEKIGELSCLRWHMARILAAISAEIAPHVVFNRWLPLWTPAVEVILRAGGKSDQAEPLSMLN